MSFDSLGLSAELQRAIKSQNYTTPTAIQQQAIPVVLDGHDLKAEAQTGTGKTAAFTLPILELLTRSPAPKRRKIRALILTPTRELAAQVADSINTYGRHLDVKTAVIFGGVGIVPQIKKLRQGVDIVVATPGRLLDHASQKTIDLSNVDFFVLDEADRMLDMGFIRDIKKIITLLPKRNDRQSLMFSATFSQEMRKLADSLLHDPKHVAIGVKNATADKVKQEFHFVEKSEKRDELVRLIKKGDWHQVLVFTRTKHGADRLARHLDRAGISASAIHGRKTQGARTRSLASFKKGAVQVLVATDIASRGIDIDQLPYVVNFDLPNVPEDYVHRIGRTARAGNSGLAASLVSPDEQPLLKAIERVIKGKISGSESGHKPKATRKRSGKKSPSRKKSSSRKKFSSRKKSSHSRQEASSGGRRKKTARKTGGRKKFSGSKRRKARAESPAIA